MRKISRAMAVVLVAGVGLGGLATSAPATDSDSGTRSCSVGYRPSLASTISSVGGTIQQKHDWWSSGGPSTSTGWVYKSALSSSYVVGYRIGSWSAAAGTTFINNTPTPGCVRDPS